MKPSNEESFVLLSKNSAKTLLVRNAMDQATLKKEALMLEKERISEERSFLKAKEHLLQRQLARSSSSCSLHLQPAENALTKWKSETDLAGELSAKPRRKELVDGNHKKQTLQSSSFPLLSEGIAKQSSPLSRRKAFGSSLSSSNTTNSLPNIHVTSSGTTGGKKYTDTKRTSQPSNKEKSGELGTETSVIDDWKELQKCRYLRSHSTNNNSEYR